MFEAEGVKVGWYDSVLSRLVYLSPFVVSARMFALAAADFPADCIRRELDGSTFPVAAQ
jgi:hypothetical protein